MLKAIIQFETGKSFSNGLWSVKKEFIDLRHRDNFISYIQRTKGYALDEVWHTEGYPFNEGQTYYTIEKNSNGKWEVIQSCWDDVSEEIYDTNKSKEYYWSYTQARDFVQKLNNGEIKIY